MGYAYQTLVAAACLAVIAAVGYFLFSGYQEAQQQSEVSDYDLYKAKCKRFVYPMHLGKHMKQSQSDIIAKCIRDNVLANKN
jgi:hypothetical protein